MKKIDTDNVIYFQDEEILIIGRYHFLFKSKSEEGYHCVDLEFIDEEYPVGGCTCIGFRARKTCRHFEKAILFSMDAI